MRVKKKRFLIAICSSKKTINIKGPLGGASFPLPSALVAISDSQLFVGSAQFANSFFSKLKRTIRGLNYGFFVEIRTEGVGFRFTRHYNAPQLLTLSLGYAHNIYYNFPRNIFFRALKYRLLLFSNHLPLLSQTALRIRNYRKPDAYKGKGLKFATETLTFKPGKLRQR